MRAFLAVATLCLFAGLLTAPAEAHVVHHRVHPMVATLGYGLAHMMATADARRHGASRRRHVARAHAVSHSRMAAQAAFLPFEPNAPFSLDFGAAQTVVNAGLGIGFGAVSSAVSVAHVAVRTARAAVEVTVQGVLGGRPADCRGIPWCGCYMRHLVGRDPGRDYNLARNWAHYGHATSPHVGAIVVWPHHVGKIVGRRNGQWIVLSGNDGHAVRERARSVASAIAFRE